MTISAKVQTAVSTPDRITSSLVLDVLLGKVDPKRLVFGTDDPQAVAERIALRDLQASSPEELFGVRELVAGKDFVEKPFSLVSVEWAESTLEASDLPFFAILHGVTYDGEMVTIGVGAKAVMRKAAKADTEGWLPQWVRIVRGKKTSDGYYPLDLAASPEPF